MRPGLVRFVLLGGFLGAGKTTAIARLARMFQARGSRSGSSPTTRPMSWSTPGRSSRAVSPSSRSPAPASAATSTA